MNAGSVSRLLHTFLLLTLALGFIANPHPARAGGAVNTLDGVAIKGYDPVAYFTLGKAAKGSEKLGYEWLGANWQFVSDANRQLFANDPMRYAPQYGGFCSVGMTAGRTFEVDPEAWRIIDSKLYLFGSKDVAQRWDPDSPSVDIADAQWEKQQAKLAK